MRFGSCRLAAAIGSLMMQTSGSTDSLVVGNCQEFTAGTQACRSRPLMTMRAGPPTGTFKATTFGSVLSLPVQPRALYRNFLDVIRRESTGVFVTPSPVSPVNALHSDCLVMYPLTSAWQKNSRCLGVSGTSYKFAGMYST